MRPVGLHVVDPEVGDQHQMRLEDLLHLHPMVLRVKAHDLGQNHVYAQLRSPLEKALLFDDGGRAQPADLLNPPIRKEVDRLGARGLGQHPLAVFAENGGQKPSDRGFAPGSGDGDAEGNRGPVATQPHPFRSQIGQPDGHEGEKYQKWRHDHGGYTPLGAGAKPVIPFSPGVNGGFRSV